MGWFTKKIGKFKNNIQTDYDTLGVIIHFTPIAIYLYTCDEYIETFDGALTFETENGNQVEIGVLSFLLKLIRIFAWTI